MDGENNGQNPIKMDDLGVPLFLETSTSYICSLENNELLGNAQRYLHDLDA